jgi:hypothetical protein
MSSGNDEQVAVVIGIEVHDDKGMLSAIQDIVLAVVILLRFLAENAPCGFFRTEYVFHAPGGPETIHTISSQETEARRQGNSIIISHT